MHSKLSKILVITRCYLVSLAVLMGSIQPYVLNAAPTPEEMDTVQELLIELRDPDFKIVSAAATKLGEHSFIEINEALIQTATKHLANPNPNSFVIGNSIKSLVNTAAPRDIPNLILLRMKLEQFIFVNPDKKAFTHIMKELDYAIDNAKYRSDDNLAELVKTKNPAPVTAPESAPVTAHEPVEEPNQNSGHESNRKIDLNDKLTLKEELKDAIARQKGGQSTGSAIDVFMAATSDFMSDKILEELRSNENFQIVGRDHEAEQVINTLSREKGKNPILLGPRGAGKTSIAQKVARIIIEEDIPSHRVFQKELAGAYVVETTPGRISSLAKSNDGPAQAAALEKYFDAVLTIEKNLGIKIVLFIDEMHTLGEGQIEAMKPYLDSRTKAMKIIFASTSVEYQNKMKNNPAIQRRLEPIGVAEQSIEEVIKIIHLSEKPRAEKRYGFKITDEAVEVIVKNATRNYPDTSRVDGSGKMLVDICTREARKLGSKNADKSVTITEQVVYDFIQSKLGYPVNPLDLKGQQKYKQALLDHLNDEVLGQERMVSDTVDEWMRLLKNNRKGVRTILMLGPTGVGKSYLGRELAKKVFGSEGAFLEVDANKFKEGSLSNNIFFGAPNGTVSSNETSGMLFNYLDDPGKGKFGGIIVINEAERAHQDFWEKMMEIMDTGRGTGGDGKERMLNRHLIVLTSNRGDTTLYPKTIEDWTESEYKAHMESLTEERLKEVFKEAANGRDQFQLPDPILARIDKFTAAEPMIPIKVQRVAVQKAHKAIRQIELDYKIKIELDERVPVEIAKASYQKGLGARPVEKKVVDLIDAAVDKYLVTMDTKAGDELKLSFYQTDKEVKIQVEGPEGKTLLPIPVNITTNLLNDPDLLGRLKNLDQELKSKIFGQNEMITRLKEAVIAHQATSGKRPLSVFVVGSTGTGKTETAKALAKSLYRSENRYQVFDMGKIIYEGELNNIFGAPAGHVGSTSERGFEQFLRENPQGGVIVFDEISNMGGKDPAQKEALFKKLYSIFEEGTWTSPSSNKTYQLSKYTIINTGNDLEQLLQGVSADDMRLSIWNRNKLPANVRTMLRKAGVPEAFLGRMADVILMKPLLKSEVSQITLKILGQQTDEFKRRGLNIKFEDSFIEDISQKFFTQDQGARSIRNLVEFRVQALISYLVIEAGGEENLKGKSIYLSIEDNLVKRTYIRTSDPDRQVTLKASLSSLGTDPAVSVQLDATEFVSRINLQSKQELMTTAYHEAGHAVVNNPKLTGERVAMITVVGQDNYLGYARYDEVAALKSSPTEQHIINQLARLFAGQKAEKMAGYPANAGWAGDLDQARRLTTMYLLEWGLGKNLSAVRVDEKGRPHLSGDNAVQFQKEMNRLFTEADKLAEQRLAENWNLVRAVVKELYTHGQITGERFKEIEARLQNKPSPIIWNKPDASERIIRAIQQKCNMKPQAKPRSKKLG